MRYGVLAMGCVYGFLGWQVEEGAAPWAVTRYCLVHLDRDRMHAQGGSKQKSRKEYRAKTHARKNEMNRT